MLDLKDFRENKLKMTQTEFAELIGVRQDNISRLEQSTDQIPLEILIRIANSTGTTLDELVNYKRPAPEPLNVIDTWRNTEFTKHSIVEYIDSKSSKYKNEWVGSYDGYIKELDTIVKTTIRKPKLAIVGHSDVGKSRLINSLIGLEKMPTSWTPTTSITVYIKHIDDRPSFIGDEVWVFKSSVKGVVGWDEKMLENESYCSEWKLAGGSVEILQNYGTRQGKKYDENEAGAAVIFLDSKILKNCDIIDLPGFGTGDRVEDDQMAFKAKEFADILIYMSHAGQFMQGGGIEYLKETINTLNVIENKANNKFKPLANLFILASQAHTVDGGNINSLNEIIDKGCNRFLESIPSGYFKDKSEISGYQYNDKEIRSRYFTYTTDIENLRIAFEDELKQLIEGLPEIINNEAKAHISNHIKSIGLNMDNEIQEYNNIINERNKYNKLLEEIENNEPRRANYNEGRREDLTNRLRKIGKKSVEEFSSYYDEVMNVDRIIEIINKQGFKRKKEDVESLVSYINSMLHNEAGQKLQDGSRELKEEIDKYISDFESSIEINSLPVDIPNYSLSFNATRAFSSGLIGLTALGGLAIWASTLGNLGAYILVAKGVSLLSAIGISVGGTAAAASGVAAIGGPVTLGIALAVIISLSSFALLSGGWKKSIAKKIIKEYEKVDAKIKMNMELEKFWKETEIAFNHAADSLENEWKEYVKDLKEIVSTYSVSEIEEKVTIAENFKNFIQGIPL